MNVQMMIGGIVFRFDSEFEMIIDEALTPFLCTEKEYSDVNIKVICADEKAKKPDWEMVGEDLLLEYYQQGNQTLCLAKGGNERYLATTICDEFFQNIECHLHFVPQGAMQTVGHIMRLLPMCSIMRMQKVLFFHASQINVGGCGIVFTAPSGTGKTTQAKLWQNCRNATIVCNDRTLIRDEKSYGYPVDGSEPVRSSEVLSVGAIVVLEQGAENEIRRLKPGEALSKLLSQLIFDSWNSEAKLEAVDQLIDLMNKSPIYLLSCTPDEKAVLCLEQQLKGDGVIWQV